MARLVRKCTQCGHLDERTTWGSIDQASKDGAFDGTWTCSSCAWSEFDLVEVDEQREEQRASTA